MKASDDDEKEAKASEQEASEESDKEEVMVIDLQEGEVSDNLEQNTSGLNTTGMTEVVDGMLANEMSDEKVMENGYEKVTENGYEKVMENGYKKVMEIDENMMETYDETIKKPRYLGVPRVRWSRGIRGRGLTNIGRGIHNSERPQPLVNPPYEEPKDWRKKYGAIQGIGLGRCLNYKNVYKELKYGTPCLVGLIEYFKQK